MKESKRKLFNNNKQVIFEFRNFSIDTLCFIYIGNILNGILLENRNQIISLAHTAKSN